MTLVTNLFLRAGKIESMPPIADQALLPALESLSRMDCEAFALPMFPSGKREVEASG